MNKEKQIEDMQNALIKIAKQPIMVDGLEDWSDIIAEKLYQAGYRKASDVEKETFDRLSNNMAKEVEGWKKHFESLYKTAKATIRAEVAREIFEEIEKLIVRRTIPDVALIDDRLITDIAELKKKYTATDTNVDCKGTEEGK